MLSPITAGNIDNDVHAVLARFRTPGATVEVVDNGRVVYRKAYGRADVASGVPARLDTRYEIGSITKQFTAAAIMQLQQAGKLDIDARAVTYLPNAPHAQEVTLRQMLTHTSGLHDDLNDLPDDSPTLRKRASFDQWIEHIAGKPLDFAPGSNESYSNMGYIYLGRIIEVVSGQSYADYIRNHFLLPLGMKHTYIDVNESRVPEMAQGYALSGGSAKPVQSWTVPALQSAGGLVSTVDDLETWSKALANGQVVSRASYAAMTTPISTTSGPTNNGLGLFIDTIEGQKRIGHTGGSAGFTTANFYFPKQGVRIIAFTNGKANPEPGEAITTVIFNRLFPAIAADAMRPAKGEDRSITERAEAVFAGMQTGNIARGLLVDRLAAKMHSQAGRWAAAFAGYGVPTSAVFKGTRPNGNATWNDYVLVFGPGVTLNFSVSVRRDGKITSLAFD